MFYVIVVYRFSKKFLRAFCFANWSLRFWGGGDAVIKFLPLFLEGFKFCESKP